jgi:hypothetical protein
MMEKYEHASVPNYDPNQLPVYDINQKKWIAVW